MKNITNCSDKCILFLVFIIIICTTGFGSTKVLAKNTLYIKPVQKDDVKVTFHPGATVSTDMPTKVIFGLPFPRNFLTDISRIRIIDKKKEIKTFKIMELARWRNLKNNKGKESIRSVLIVLDYTFRNKKPLSITVQYGKEVKANKKRIIKKKKNILKQFPEAWTAISNSKVNPDEYPVTDNIREPVVYVTLPKEWLGYSLLRTRTLPVGSNRKFRWYDTALLNFSKTAVNDVEEYVSKDSLVDYISKPAPWLYDRAMTLFGVYIRTGAVKWLRHAHRATQFYSKHLSATGYFDLKTYDDLKYSYGQSMVLDMMLTGDTGLLTPIRNVASAAATWPETYSTSLNFWTERHQTYALLGALSAWEATGESAYANRVTEIVNASINQAQNPANGWAVNGCMLHTVRQHEGDDNDEPICSPWMSALFADAMWRYYLHSEDKRALSFLVELGKFVQKHGLYDGKQEHHELSGMLVPWYISSNVKKITDSGAWADLEHTCDIAGLLARAVWSSRKLGSNASALNKTAKKLMSTCQRSMKRWHRPVSSIRARKPAWRLSPSHKYNWWFGTTSDLTWFTILNN